MEKITKKEYIEQWTSYINIAENYLGFCSVDKYSKEVKELCERLKELIPHIADTKNLGE